MAKLAVVQTGGKQYLVKKDNKVVVDKIDVNGKSKIDLDTLAAIDTEKNTVKLGNPFLKEKTKAELIENIRGDKIRVAKFKAKVRYRKVKGFRSSLSKIKILTI